MAIPISVRESRGQGGVARPASDAASRPSNGRHIPALDGIRAIAILLVIAHNAGPIDGTLSGVLVKAWALFSNAGWIGVQLFFALSGFLITRILLDAEGSDGWRRTFYARRVLRIFPLYYALLALVFIGGPHIALLAPLHTTGTRSGLWFFAYLSNWMSPFGNLPAMLPHLWSLAVEEQIYLLWPFLIGLFDEQGLSLIFTMMIASAWIARIGLHAVFPASIADVAAYTFTIARWDGIAFGALVALAVRDERVTTFLRRHLRAIASVGAGLLLVAAILDRGIPAEGTITEVASQTLVGFLSALLVFFCVTGGSQNGASSTEKSGILRMLSHPVLRTIGKYSYAIYVFQTPVHLILFPHYRAWVTGGSNTHRFLAHVAYTGAVFAISFALALVSWYTLEQPFLMLKRFVPTRDGRRAREEVGIAVTGEPATLP